MSVLPMISIRWPLGFKGEVVVAEAVLDFLSEFVGLVNLVEDIRKFLYVFRLVAFHITDVSNCRCGKCGLGFCKFAGALLNLGND